LPDPNLFREVGKRVQPDGFFMLLQLQHVSVTDPTDVSAFRLTTRKTSVQFGTDLVGGPIIWTPTNFQLDTVESAGDGSLTSLRVTFPNPGGTLLSVIADREFREQPAELWFLNSALLNSPESVRSWKAAASQPSGDERAATISLSNELLFDRTVPSVVAAPEGCQRIYGQPGCSFPIQQLDPGMAILGDCALTRPACRARGQLALANGVASQWPLNYLAAPGVI
jgi:hypothetical protein